MSSHCPEDLPLQVHDAIQGLTVPECFCSKTTTTKVRQTRALVNLVNYPVSYSLQASFVQRFSLKARDTETFRAESDALPGSYTTKLHSYGELDLEIRTGNEEDDSSCYH